MVHEVMQTISNSLDLDKIMMDTSTDLGSMLSITHEAHPIVQEEEDDLNSKIEEL